MANLRVLGRKALHNPQKVPRYLARKFKEWLLWDHFYAALPEPKKPAPNLEDPRFQERLVEELRAADFTLAGYKINGAAFREYFSRAAYENFPGYYAGGWDPLIVEKALEHYVAAQLLEVGKQDVYIDIASGDSPVAQIYSRLFGCQTYRQDMIFPAGLRGNSLGGSAAALPVADGFASKMALHCSFEHFEGDQDIRFLREAERVLRPGGRLCILPLYLSPEYAIQTDPVVVPRRGIEFDPEAVLYAARGYGYRFGRFYDIAHLDSRLRANRGPLAMTIYVVQNAKEISPDCYLKFALLFEKRIT